MIGYLVLFREITPRKIAWHSPWTWAPPKTGLSLIQVYVKVVNCFTCYVRESLWQIDLPFTGIRLYDALIQYRAKKVRLENRKW